MLFNHSLFSGGILLWDSSNISFIAHMLRTSQFIRCWLDLEYVKPTEVPLLPSQVLDTDSKSYALLKARMAAKSIFSTARKSWIWWALTLSHESLFMAHTCPTHDRMKVTFSWYYKCFISQFFDRVAKRWQSVVIDFNFLDKLKKNMYGLKKF